MLCFVSLFWACGFIHFVVLQLFPTLCAGRNVCFGGQSFSSFDQQGSEEHSFFQPQLFSSFPVHHLATLSGPDTNCQTALSVWFGWRTGFLCRDPLTSLYYSSSSCTTKTWTFSLSWDPVALWGTEWWRKPDSEIKETRETLWPQASHPITLSISFLIH